MKQYSTKQAIKQIAIVTQDKVLITITTFNVINWLLIQLKLSFQIAVLIAIFI